MDSQLDESPLTLADLRRIEDSMIRTLTAMFHPRVPYPKRPSGE